MDQPTLFRTGVCTECGQGFPVGPTGVIAPRCRPCARERQLAQQRAWLRQNYEPIKQARTCRDCGVKYPAPGRDTNSSRCADCRASRRVRALAQERRRLAQRDNRAERFSRLEIFDRDGWVCQLCTHQIDPETKYPDPHSASLDHIVPLSLGGAHTRANTQLACLRCNRIKSNRMT